MAEPNDHAEARSDDTRSGGMQPLIDELELALRAARSQLSLIRESLTTVIDYLDRHPGT